MGTIASQMGHKLSITLVESCMRDGMRAVSVSLECKRCCVETTVARVFCYGSAIRW